MHARVQDTINDSRAFTGFARAYLVSRCVRPRGIRRLIAERAAGLPRWRRGLRKPSAPPRRAEDGASPLVMHELTDLAWISSVRPDRNVLICC